MHRKRHYRAEDTNIQRAAIDQQLFSSVHSCLRLWKDSDGPRCSNCTVVQRGPTKYDSRRVSVG